MIAQRLSGHDPSAPELPLHMIPGTCNRMKRTHTHTQRVSCGYRTAGYIGADTHTHRPRPHLDWLRSVPERRIPVSCGYRAVEGYTGADTRSNRANSRATQTATALSRASQLGADALVRLPRQLLARLAAVAHQPAARALARRRLAAGGASGLDVAPHRLVLSVGGAVLEVEGMQVRRAQAGGERGRLLVALGGDEARVAFRSLRTGGGEAVRW